MPGRYLLSPEARRDIEQIRDYYLEQAGAQVARHVLGQITKAMRFLAASPGAGHRRDDLTDEDVRFWPVLSYLERDEVRFGHRDGADFGPARGPRREQCGPL